MNSYESVPCPSSKSWQQIISNEDSFEKKQQVCGRIELYRHVPTAKLIIFAYDLGLLVSLSHTSDRNNTIWKKEKCYRYGAL